LSDVGSGGFFSGGILLSALPAALTIAPVAHLTAVACDFSTGDTLSFGLQEFAGSFLRGLEQGMGLVLLLIDNFLHKAHLDHGSRHCVEDAHSSPHKGSHPVTGVAGPVRTTWRCTGIMRGSGVCAAAT
jgi:hypothetical protein